MSEEARKSKIMLKLNSEEHDDVWVTSIHVGRPWFAQGEDRAGKFSMREIRHLLPTDDLEMHFVGPTSESWKYDNRISDNPKLTTRDGLDELAAYGLARESIWVVARDALAIRDDLKNEAVTWRRKLASMVAKWVYDQCRAKMPWNHPHQPLMLRVMRPILRWCRRSYK